MCTWYKLEWLLQMTRIRSYCILGRMGGSLLEWLSAVELEIQFHYETFPKMLQVKISKNLLRICYITCTDVSENWAVTVSAVLWNLPCLLHVKLSKLFHRLSLYVSLHKINWSQIFIVKVVVPKSIQVLPMSSLLQNEDEPYFGK